MNRAKFAGTEGRDSSRPDKIMYSTVQYSTVQYVDELTEVEDGAGHGDVAADRVLEGGRPGEDLHLVLLPSDLGHR